MSAMCVLQFASEISKPIKASCTLHIAIPQNLAEGAVFSDLNLAGLLIAIGDKELNGCILPHVIHILEVQIRIVLYSSDFKAAAVFLF